ncbi:MAG: glycosyltransferase [Cephaloticoccus sp.]|nr:glycosyltransferase [Cephaloticoccus sp.]
MQLATLLADNPELAEARDDFTADGFGLHLRPWLVQHILPTIPPGSLLTLLDPRVFFFQSPRIVLDGIGDASIALVRIDCDPRNGPSRLSNAWISLRHDETGLACAKAWTTRSMHHNAGPRMERVHGRELERSFPEVKAAHSTLISGVFWPSPTLLHGAVGSGPTINGQTVVAFCFHGLRRLDQGIYDPGAELRHIAAPAPWRELIYLPYLQELEINYANQDIPDLIPLSNPNDPRNASILKHLVALTSAEIESVHDLREALAQSRTETRRLVTEFQAKTAESEHYIHEVEQDRNKQRQAYFDTRQRLEEIHQDLLNNIAYLKKLEGNAVADKQAAQDREAYIASLKEQLATHRNNGSTSTDLATLYQALLPFGCTPRRLLIARFNPALMPLLLCLAAQGVTIEVLGSPEGMSNLSQNGVHFLGGNLWDWLGGLESCFDETRYLAANPDVATAISEGAVTSGWEHYLSFGQYEGRDTGSPGYRSGLADFDAIAFDSADASDIVPCLIGRLQPHHQLFVSSSFNPATVWLPADTPRTIIQDDLLCCPKPSPMWLGPARPSALPAPHRAAEARSEPCPASPTQPAIWPKISIIVTGRDQVSALEVTLQSILKQRYPMLECIVVDGASNDGSVDLLQKLNDQLTWWTSNPIDSPAQSFNLGLAKASGTLLAWLAPGESLAPGALFTVAQQYLLHEPDVLGGRCGFSTPDGTIATHRSVFTLGQLQPLPLSTLCKVEDFWLKDAFFRMPAFFITRRALDLAGGLRPDSPVPDYSLVLALARRGARVLPLPEILARQSPAPRFDSNVHAMKRIAETIMSKTP